MKKARVLLLLLVLLAACSAVAETIDTTYLSFNIRYGRADDGLDSWQYRHDKVCATIAAHGPAIFGVQECLPEQADVVRGCFPGYEFTGVGRDDGQQKGEMCAIFTDRSRYEVLDSGVFWLSETPWVVGSVGWDAAMTRIASWVKLRDKKCLPEILYVFNTHFDHVGVEARRQSALLLKEKIAEIAGDHPAVLMGDFNADAEGSAPIDALAGDDLHDSWSCASRGQRQKGPGTFHGFTGETSRGRIDWILTTPGLPCLDAGIDRVAYDGHYPSDHYPVWATVRQKLRPELIADYAQFVDPLVGTRQHGPHLSRAFGPLRHGPAQPRHAASADVRRKREVQRRGLSLLLGLPVRGRHHRRLQPHPLQRNRPLRSGRHLLDAGHGRAGGSAGGLLHRGFRHETETAEPGYYRVCARRPRNRCRTDGHHPRRPCIATPSNRKARPRSSWT